jgi:hypothetical protein
MSRITVAVLAIFCAGYIHIFGKESGGYDNYVFKGHPVYFDYTDGGVLQVPADQAVTSGAGRQGCVVALGVQHGLGKPQGSVDSRQPSARPLWTAWLTG